MINDDQAKTNEKAGGEQMPPATSAAAPSHHALTNRIPTSQPSGAEDEMVPTPARVAWLEAMYAAYHSMPPEQKGELLQWQSEHLQMSNWPGWIELIGLEPTGEW